MIVVGLELSREEDEGLFLKRVGKAGRRELWERWIGKIEQSRERDRLEPLPDEKEDGGGEVMVSTRWK